jgi:hypothetical protein
MTIPKIFTDFQNADKSGRIRLNVNGAIRDIQKLNIESREGMQIILDDEEGLSAIGEIKFSKEENIWVAEINWDTLK